jgi:hypothetical protein
MIGQTRSKQELFYDCPDTEARSSIGSGAIRGEEGHNLWPANQNASVLTSEGPANGLRWTKAGTSKNLALDPEQFAIQLHAFRLFPVLAAQFFAHDRVRNAVRLLSPRQSDGNGRGRTGSDPVRNNGRALPSAQRAEIASLLGLEPFARFVYAITILERHSDQECSVLLGCTRREVVSARTQALQQLASEAATHYRQQPTAGPENPASHGHRNSGLQLLIAPGLATSS